MTICLFKTIRLFPLLLGTNLFMLPIYNIRHITGNVTIDKRVDTKIEREAVSPL